MPLSKLTDLSGSSRFDLTGTNGWTWEPDRGHAGDMIAFCAALAP